MFAIESAMIGDGDYLTYLCFLQLSGASPDQLAVWQSYKKVVRVVNVPENQAIMLHRYYFIYLSVKVGFRSISNIVIFILVFFADDVVVSI